MHSWHIVPPVPIVSEQLKPSLPDYPSLQAKEKEEAERQFWCMTPSTKLRATDTWRPCVGYGPPLWRNSGRTDCSEVLPSLNSIWTTVQKPLPSDSLSKRRTTKNWSTWGRYNTNRSQCFTTITYSRRNCSNKEWPNFHTAISYPTWQDRKNWTDFPKR